MHIGFSLYFSVIYIIFVDIFVKIMGGGELSDFPVPPLLPVPAGRRRRWNCDWDALCRLSQ